MKRVLAVFLAALCAGCATEVVSTSLRTVVVRGLTADYADAQKLADAQCAKHGRFARLAARRSKDLEEFVYDCVQ